MVSMKAGVDIGDEFGARGNSMSLPSSESEAEESLQHAECLDIISKSSMGLEDGFEERLFKA